MIFWFVPTVWGLKDVNPYLFQLGEMIRCRFEMGLCLSIYPNPEKSDKDVTATIRVQIQYSKSKICLAKEPGYSVGDCNIKENGKGNYMCTITFPAKPGLYYAFIDDGSACANQNPIPQQHKTKVIELRTLT